MTETLCISTMWRLPSKFGKSYLSLPLATQMDRLREQNELETRQQK